MSEGDLQPVLNDRCGTDAATQLASLFADWFGGLSHTTRKNYGQDLDSLASFLGVPDRAAAGVRICEGPQLVARSLVLRWRAALREKREAPGTINRRLSSVRSLYRHVVGHSLVVPSLRATPRRRVVNRNAVIVASLLEAARGEVGARGLRDTALVILLHDSGLRRAEVASLRLQDLDLPGRVAWVQGKGHHGERQPVDLSEPAVEALRSYLASRGPVDPSAPLFANQDRAGKGVGHLTPEGIRIILRTLSRRAGLSQSVSPHDCPTPRKSQRFVA